MVSGELGKAGSETTEEFIQLSECALRNIHFFPEKSRQKIKIVFIAGWATQIDTWQSVLEQLCRQYPVYYLETREKVSSRPVKGAKIGVSEIARDIAEFVQRKELGEGDYILIGSSLGATAIAESFSYLEAKPRAAVLINPNAVFRVPLIWKIIVRMFYPPLYFMILPVVKWYLRRFRLNVEADPRQYQKYARALDAADPWKLRKAVLAFSGYSIWNALDWVSCPVLIVGASQDKLHEPDLTRRIMQSLKEARLVDLKTNEAAHGAALINCVNRFLKSH